MTSAFAACPKCRSSLPGALCNPPEPVVCPVCRTVIWVEVFPAAFQAPAAGAAAETIVEEGTASCFYHEQKKAVTHCDACGRFLCALCDVDFSGRHLCPGCLQTGKKKGKLALDAARVLWDSSALFLSLMPLIVFPVVVVTAPIAMTLAVISFFKPGSLVPRRPWRAVLAIVIGLASLASWFWVFIYRD